MSQDFFAVKTEGALLTRGLLNRLSHEDPSLPGTDPKSFHLAKQSELREEISRAWNRALEQWATFRALCDALPEQDQGTTLTRERWLLPLFRFFDYGRLPTAPKLEIEGKTYAVSHLYRDRFPVHLVSFRHDLDKRIPGATRTSPQTMVQELLNRSDDYLWACLSNGLVLRLLRDNVSLSRPAYVEFDLQAMFDGESFADFRLLYLILHQSRVEQPDNPDLLPEVWAHEARETGTRSLEHLREGVEKTLAILGQGFLAHPANDRLRQALKDGALSREGFYHELLRIVYRLIFLLVAEDRQALHAEDVPDAVRQRYYRNYSLSRIRTLADQRIGSPTAGDLWECLKVTCHAVDEGQGLLGLSGFGGALFADAATGYTSRSQLANEPLLAAMRALAFTEESRVRVAVDFRNLGSEELGSVYESLLELHPTIHTEAATFELKTVAGSERKVTGSYYTPTELIECLLDSALDPVVEERLKQARELANREIASRGRDLHASQLVPGPQRVAGGNGPGGTGLSANQDISQGRAVRNDISDPARRLLDPGEHRGRLGAGGNQGVHPVSPDSPRQPQGTGDPLAPLRTSRTDDQSGSAATARSGDRNREDAPFPDWFFAAQAAVGPTSLPPYSLLAEKALLSLRVCDPACGSGHFLVGAAHRIAQALASVRCGEDEPTPEDHRQALREVISHCIYGVDLNPLAVELCRVALWMESLVPGKPLSFLTSHVKCGNSLVGATPGLIERGIPDGAYTAKTGDDKAFAAAFRKKNKAESKDAKGLYQLSLFDDQPWNHLGDLARHVASLEVLQDDSLEHRQEKERCYAELIQSAGYLSGHFLADLWCAPFFWPLRPSEELPFPPTSAHLWKVERNPHDCPHWMRAEVQRLASEHRFFHWHLEFPEVFGEDRQGFDCLIGNPPWEQVVLIEKEFFASRAPEIAEAPTAAARTKLINALSSADPQSDPDRLKLWHDYENAKHGKESETIFIKESGRYQFLCGKLNTYQAFAALFRQIIGASGCLGIIVPSGIATDDSNKGFFSDLVNTESLVSLYDFENRDGIFPGVHRSYKFCLLSVGTPGAGGTGADFAFFLTSPRQLAEEVRHFALTREDIALLNPNTKTCPIFRSKLDAELTRYIYRRVPVLVDETRPDGNPWGITFRQGLFNMSSDSHLFRTADELGTDGWELRGNVFCRDGAQYLPLCEAKMNNLYDHRHGSITGSDDLRRMSGVPAVATTAREHADPEHCAIPRYWVPSESVAQEKERIGWCHPYFFTFRDVARSTDVRTAIHSIIPSHGVGHKAPIILPDFGGVATSCCLHANLNSYVADYLVRQGIGGISLSFFVLRQVACLPPQAYGNESSWRRGTPLETWVAPRVLELTYTAWDLQAFASCCGYDGPPLQWQEDRRRLIQCELDAAFFHLYLGTPDEWRKKGSPELLGYFPTPRQAVDYIMDTFPIVKRKDEAEYGDYRTKLQILAIHDAMAEAIATGQPYQTLLDPPPGPPANADGTFIPMAEWHTLDPHRTSHIHPQREAEVPIPDVILLPMPKEPRVPAEKPGLYVHSLLRQALHQAGGELPLSVLADVCFIAAYPDVTESRLDGRHHELFCRWRRAFNEGDCRGQFRPAMEELVRTGRIHLRSQGSESVQVHVPDEWRVSSHSADPWVEYDAVFCLSLARAMMPSGGLCRELSEARKEVVEVLEVAERLSRPA